MSPSNRPDDADDALAAGAELCALLQQLRATAGRTYEQLAEKSMLSRGTVGNYLTKPGHRRKHRELELLLAALDATPDEHARALDRLRRTTRRGADPLVHGWRARARAEDCTAWVMAEFTPHEANVHTAIGRRIDPVRRHSADAQPRYVPRTHDPALRADIAAAAAGELRALIVVRGTSSTGKTRSLWEAVQQLCPGWAVIRPRSAAVARHLPDSGLLDRPVVVWLNELQGYLAPNGAGLSLHVLHDLYTAATAPVVLVGSLWPDRIEELTRDDDGEDRRSEARELLAAGPERVRWHDVAAVLDKRELVDAREFAMDDARLARAVENVDRVGFAQTLAGAYQLLEHYHCAPPPARLLLDAAADARRLGHTRALSAELLRTLALALWREERGATSPPAFGKAIDYASAPLPRESDSARNNANFGDRVRALTPLDHEPQKPGDDPSAQPVGVGLVGYALADYLEQHLTRTRRLRPVPDRVWHALTAHSRHPDDLAALAAAADARGRFGYAEALLNAAAAAGDPRPLAWWLAGRPERERDAERVYRDAAAAGGPGALLGLTRWLDGRPEREGDAERVYRDAAAAGDPDALLGLARWLTGRPGRQADAERVYRDAAAADDPGALLGLARWLAGRPGREGDVERIYRDAAAAGGPGALLGLARWLDGRPGRQGDVEQVYQDAAAAGDPVALRELASWLVRTPGCEGDVERVYRDAAAAGDPVALRELARWWVGQPGRQGDAERAYRDAVAAGDPHGPLELARWLARQPGRESEVEQILQDAAAVADPDVLLGLARWLAGRTGWEVDAERTYRVAAAAGNRRALLELAQWLAGQLGREGDAEQTYREAAVAGNRRALLDLAQWLGGRPGREGDAEQAHRDAAVAGDPGALRALADWLVGRPRRKDEAALVRRVGLNADGGTAVPG